MQYSYSHKFTAEPAQDWKATRSFLEARKQFTSTFSSLPGVSHLRASEGGSFACLTPPISNKIKADRPASYKLLRNKPGSPSDEDVEIKYTILRSPSWSGDYGNYGGLEVRDVKPWLPHQSSKSNTTILRRLPSQSNRGASKLTYDGGTSTSQTSDLDWYAETGYIPPVKTQDDDVRKEAKLVGTLLNPCSDDFTGLKAKTFPNTIDDHSSGNHSMKQKLKRLGHTQMEQSGRKISTVFKSSKLTSKKMIEACKKRLSSAERLRPQKFSRDMDRESPSQTLQKGSVHSLALAPSIKDRVVPQLSKQIKKAATTPEITSPAPESQNNNSPKFRSKSTVVNGCALKLDFDANMRMISPCYLAGEATRISTPTTTPLLPSSSTRNGSPVLEEKAMTFPSYFDLKRQRKIGSGSDVHGSRQTPSPPPRTSPKLDTTGSKAEETTRNHTSRNDASVHKYSSHVTSPLTLRDAPSATAFDYIIPGGIESSSSTFRRASHPLVSGKSLIEDSSSGDYWSRRKSYAYGELVNFLSRSNSYSGRSEVQTYTTTNSRKQINPQYDIESHSVPGRESRKMSTMQGKGSLLSYASDNLRSQHIGEEVNIAAEAQSRRTSKTVPLVSWRGCLVTKDEYERLNMFFNPTYSSQSNRPQECVRENRNSKIKSTKRSTHSDQLEEVPKITRDYVIDIPESSSPSRGASISTSDGYNESDEGVSEMYAEACQEITGTAIGVVKRTKTFNSGTDLLSVQSSTLPVKSKSQLTLINNDNSGSEDEDNWKSVSMLYNHVLHQPHRRKSSRQKSVVLYRQEQERAPELFFFTRKSPDITFLTSAVNTSQTRSISDSKLLEERFNSLSDNYIPFTDQSNHHRRSSVSAILRAFSFGSVSWKSDSRKRKLSTSPPINPANVVHDPSSIALEDLTHLS